MNFSTPAHVGSVVWDLKYADLTRSDNRRKINQLFDGWPPFTQAEVAENKIPVNINFKQATVLGHQARRQYENAFLKPENFFNVSVDRGDPAKRQDWSQFITKRINRRMKRDWAYIQLVRSKFAGVVLHGIGPQMWECRWNWRPRHVAVEDLLVPTDTDESLENLPFFAVRRVYTVAELVQRTQGANVDPGWRQPVVRKLIDSIKGENLSATTYTWIDNPEKMFELFKQNQVFWSVDSAPSITLWDFFYMDESEKGGWKRCMIQDVEGSAPADAEFVYQSNRIFGRDLINLLHIQFGDLSNKPPFHYHSVRSLGFQMFDVCHMMNRLLCKFTARVFEDLLTLFRSKNPADVARINRVLLYDKGIVDDGLTFVKNEERPVVNVELVQTLLANWRQIASESSAAYTQEIDSGTQKEETATAVIAKVNQVNAMMGGLLNLAYVQEEFAYREICRRFCNPKTENADCRKFQQECSSYGIPKEVLDVEAWDITAEQVVGGGNKMLEIAQTKEIMAVRPLLDPDPQRLALHMYLEALSDSKTANALAPLDGRPKVTDSVHDAELSFGALMMGVPMNPKPGMNHVEQIETLLRLLAFKVTTILKSGGVGTPDDVSGFRAVALFIQKHITLLAQDETAKDKVAAYSKSLGKIMNEVKAMAQRQQEQNGNGQIDPETIADIQREQVITQQKLQSKEVAARQKLAHQQIAFQADQQRQNAATAAEIGRENLRAQAEIAGQGMRDAAEASTPEKKKTPSE